MTVLERLAVLRTVPAALLVLPVLHAHVWTRFAGSVGVFHCGDPACLWCAVCPGCFGGLDVALHLADGLPGMVLFWCAQHGTYVEGDDELSA